MSRDILANRRFVAVWLAQLISQFGDFVALMALFSLVAFRGGGTPSEVSGILVAFYLPTAFLGPLAGVLVDRWDVKRTMIASDLVRAVLAGLMALAGDLGQLYALFFALSAVSCFFGPAQTVAVPLLVRKDQLLLANSLNAQAVQVNKVAGPAVAGLLVAAVGERACFLIDGATFVASAALLATVRMAREAAAPAGAGPRALLADLREGLAFLRHHRGLSLVTASLVGAVLGTGVFDALSAVYVRDVLGASTRVFTTMVSLVGAGTILGAFVLARLPADTPRPRLVAIGIAGLGLALVPLAAARLVTVALAASLGLGLATAAAFIAAQTFVQEETPPALLGRVGSAVVSAVTLAKLAGVSAAGILAAWLGVRSLYFVVASALVAVGVLGYWYARAEGVSATTRP